MPVYKGVGCHWGVSSSTVSTVSGQFQTRDLQKRAEIETIKNGNGETVAKIFYDPSAEATFEYIPTAATVNGTMNPTLPAMGDVLTVTDSTFTAIAGTAWLVEDVHSKSANSSAMKVTIKLASYPNITG